MRAGKRRYFSMGWSIHLPGYGSPFGADGPGPAFYRSIHECMFVQRLELMAHFQVAHESKWFRDSIHHLQAFQADQGTYRFPGRYLREGSRGYWVTGAYMRLEENRRARRSLDLDSTFRMCVIENLARGEKQ
jgi:hypothetical protein